MATIGVGIVIVIDVDVVVVDLDFIFNVFIVSPGLALLGLQVVQYCTFLFPQSELLRPQVWREMFLW